MPYNVTPTSMTGQGAFGRVPGVVDLPDPAADLAAQIPNLGQLNSSISANLLARSRGQLSPATLAALQDTNAAWAAGSGMFATTPGTISTNRLARNIGLTAEDQAAKAIEQYGSWVPTVSRTQTVSPETEIALAERNAAYLAAPDPTAAASYAEQLYQKYLRGMSGGGGTGPQGGTYRPIQRDTGGGQSTFVLPSTGTGMYYGGVLQDPTSGGGGSGGYTYYGGGGGDTSASGTGYYAGMGDEDLYNYFGMTSGDMVGLGLTEGDLYNPGGGLDYGNDYYGGDFLGGGEDTGDVGYDLGF